VRVAAPCRPVPLACQADGMTGAHTLLVVDDQAPFRFAAKPYCAPGGFELARGASGAEAIALVDELHPDLVLMDINMPA